MRQFIQTTGLSRSVIAGGVLQIAKQGISQVYSGLHACPNGRSLGAEPLKNVIWQARNQTTHFEEGQYSNAVRRCFRNLESQYGPRFQLARENLAFEVLQALGWRSYSAYERDMHTLLR